LQFEEDAASAAQSPLFAVRDVWLGAMVPKRWAKRAVTRNSIKRQIINPAEECTTDKLGRVLLPASLRSHAELDRDIWFVGMGGRFEIWSKATYSRVTAQDEKNFPIDSEALAGLGI
jgi:division/cell wall cluster transcriptional repressor MraZ